MADYYVDVSSGNARAVGEFVGFPQAAWDMARAATNGGHWQASGLCGTQRSNGFSYFHIHRTFYPIQTQDIGADAIISAASLHWYVSAITADAENDAESYITLTKGEMGDPEDLDGTDLDSITWVEGVDADQRVDITDSVGWHEFVLNLTGIGWINKTGWTNCFLMAVGHDMVDEYPNNDGYSLVQISCGGQANEPYLEVTATTPPSTQDYWKGQSGDLPPDDRDLESAFSSSDPDDYALVEADDGGYVKKTGVDT